MAKIVKQLAALPVAMIGGHPHVLLITSRETRRWIIPKGHPDRHLAASALAGLEAFEEAGVSGDVRPEPIGRYRSVKRLASGKCRPCEVTVFRLDVARHLDAWKEMGERERRWLPLAEAAALAADGGLGDFLAGLDLEPEAGAAEAAREAGPDDADVTRAAVPPGASAPLQDLGARKSQGAAATSKRPRRTAPR